MICVVGMGPGNIKCLTQEAIEIVKQADRVIAFGRIAKTAEQIKTPVTQINGVNDLVEHIEQERNIAVLASGDPCFYGVLEYLKKNNIPIDRVIPGISSFQYLMAKLKKSWHNAHFVSLHGRDGELEQIKNYGLTVILTDKQHTPHHISKRLQDIGVMGKMYVGYNLSYDDECIIEKLIGADIEKYGEVSVVVVERL